LDTTTETSPSADPTPPPAAAGSPRGPVPALVRRHPWVVGCASLVVIATVLVAWLGTSPGFDPYGWLVWGYQTLRLNLNLGGAPSWKPFTYLFTVPYSIFGHLAWWLWMITAVAVALGGPIIAARIVYRIVRPGSEQSWPAIVGALFAAGGVLGINGDYGYFHYILSAQSDPMLVTVFLLAIDMHLSKRYRLAYTFLWLCSLARPETWPFLGLYLLWAWRAHPSMRRFLVAGIILLAFLWFGIPVLSGNPPFVAGQLADMSPRMIHGSKIHGVLGRFRSLSYWPVDAAAGIGVVIAAWRRNWTVLMIAGCSALWVLIEIAFALHGWPAVWRYMFEAAGAMIVVAGIGVAWLLQEGAKISRQAQVGAAVVVLALVGALVPDAVAAIRKEHKDIYHERARTAEIKRLDATIRVLGGYQHIRFCGDPSADVEWVSILAWYTKLDVGYVGHRPQFEIRHQHKSDILFTALFNGWVVHTYHLPASKQAACGALNGATYIVTPQHPGGLLLHTS
jgi:hypothetical protein